MPAPSSQKATPPLVLYLNPISPSSDLLKPSPTPLNEGHHVVFYGPQGCACQLFLLFLDGCLFLRAEYRDALPQFVVCLVVIPLGSKSDPHIA
ncbi:hypothetical protein Tco_0541512 [Tanacetum coccineum]